MIQYQPPIDFKTSFLYGNYDGLNKFPTFELNLGADTWSNITFTGNTETVRREIIHVLSSDYIHVCLIKTGTTIPFISALEFRPLNNTAYRSGSGSLQTLQRCDCAEMPSTFTRYTDDIYDRIWRPFKWTSTGTSTQSEISNLNEYRVPVNVLSTASGPDDVSEPFGFYWDATSASDQFYIYLHFAELVETPQSNQIREFNIYLNEELWYKRGRFVPDYLKVFTIYSDSKETTGKDRYTISLKKTERSTLPPIINAYEIYSVKNFSDSGTNETDVSAILNIKSTYKVIKDWQGDPCEPQDSQWDGLNCSYPSSNHSARIISLNLSSSQMTGEIISSIANLTQLNTLDLSNNSLSGQVPEFLSLLPLGVLNLKGNKFTSPLPAQLLKNQKNGSLSLSYDSVGEEKKTNKYIPAVVGTVLGLVLLAAILFGIWMIKGRKIDIERKDRQYTYSEVLEMTKNLQEKLGEGSFSIVYRGSVGDTQVAVKILNSQKTTKRDFKNEVRLLMRVHHKNLTSIVGYCDEDPYMVIIYEYMAGRSLKEYLSGISNWVERLQLALDIAQGLEYLHDGCKPAIIHRDVKTSNILLNEQFQAKLADFGLSRAYSDEGGTHVSTNHVAGTHGYIDPDYEYTKKLTEKSDVFSFGVVLLEMITRQPPLIQSRTEETIYIYRWVSMKVQNGDVREVVDPRFGRNYNVRSVQKAIELALSCTSRESSVRPTMNMVVTNLKVAAELCTHDVDAHPQDSNEISTDRERSMVPRVPPLPKTNVLMQDPLYFRGATA
ncbi:hypothetical protein DCAR_0934337 [Daucus carota subsp. sativus]|uniref:Protein kinase domain-containing protein n=1 Tax=Daucus carota subsp. sativus TaxID=79200 RepID=A0AAF0XXQ6_DAUCS|nr:hypothetical protein DCAR_0934337 [Daucus carota subsp. sativus]